MGFTESRVHETPVWSSNRLITRMILSSIVAVIVLAGCSLDSVLHRTQGNAMTLHIATTTSLDDSGLLAEILPDFEDRHNIETSVIAVGTGQALALGERGDVDLVLVHAPELEEAFVEHGFGVERVTIMTNPFIIVGMRGDPADVGSATDAADALMRIADANASFVSRADDSGTHVKELSIWDVAGFMPESGLDWYHGAGQGMSETLLTAHELEAYTLTDRATFVVMSAQLPDLAALYGDPNGPGSGDPLLANPYSVIAVNPERHPDTSIEAARHFIEWINSDSTRERIAEHGIDTYGESLFTLVDR
jgi:tungstate transport system substrate-binding protein